MQLVAVYNIPQYPPLSKTRVMSRITVTYAFLASVRMKSEIITKPSLLIQAPLILSVNFA